MPEGMMERRPEIAYPCPWTYRIVCTDEFPIRAALPGLVGAVEHTLVLVRTSRAGNYCTLQLELVVRDEAQRLAIFQALTELVGVMLIL